MKPEPTQPATQMTQPKEGEPVEIPIPTKQDVFRDLAKTARPKSERKPRKDQRRRSKDYPEVTYLIEKYLDQVHNEWEPIVKKWAET